jgi:hypothetical protein
MKGDAALVLETSRATLLFPVADESTQESRDSHQAPHPHLPWPPRAVLPINGPTTSSVSDAAAAPVTTRLRCFLEVLRDAEII